MALGGCTDFSIGDLFNAFAAFGWRDQSSPSVVRREHSMIPGEVDARFWHECRQSCDEIHRLECHLRGAIPVRRLQGIENLAGGTE